MTASTDIETLSNLLTLPVTPESVRFTERPIGAGADRQVVARIEFGDRIDDALALLPEDPRLNNDRGVTPPEWLDTQPFASVTREQGDLLVVTEGARDASAFAKDAFRVGFALREPGADAVLVVMQTQ